MLPLAWVIPVLMILGAAAGFILLAHWQKETGKRLVDARGLTVERKEGKRQVTRERIGEVFTGDEDLLGVTVAGEELLRTPVDDELAAQLV